ncbi:hypothetical protein A2U01_0091829, partial [Trifolium medium]|nr:hypothetical protein [Trifolium medium]
HNWLRWLVQISQQLKSLVQLSSQLCYLHPSRHRADLANYPLCVGKCFLSNTGAGDTIGLERME